MQPGQSEQSMRSYGRAPYAYTFQVGLVAGLIWGGLWQLCYTFQFTRHSAGFLLQPFLATPDLQTRSALIGGYALFIAFSLVIATILHLFVHRFTPDPRSLPFIISVATVCWIVAALCDVQRPLWLEWGDADWHSLITDYCLFLQWSLFICMSLATARKQANILNPRNL